MKMLKTFKMVAILPTFATVVLLSAVCPAQAPPVPTPQMAAPKPPPPPPRKQEDAITPAIKDPNRHTEFLNRIKEGDTSLLFLGDSIMDYWEKRGEYSWTKFAPYHPADFGVSGDRTEHVLWRIENGELEGIHPKVTVIMIGTNNTAATEQPEWIAAGVQKIVETVHSKLPDTKILLLAIFPRDNKASTRRVTLAKVNAMIAKLDNGKSIRYLDIGNVFLGPDGEIPPDVMPDRLHPSSKGYDLWYDAMMPTVVQMMK